jgi:hypothetical protein
MLESPLPALSRPEALGALKAMSSTSTALLPALIVSAAWFGGPVTFACPPT